MSLGSRTYRNVAHSVDSGIFIDRLVLTLKREKCHEFVWALASSILSIVEFSTICSARVFSEMSGVLAELGNELFGLG